MNGPALSPGTVPVGPLLSMYDPIFIGVDEFGAPVYTKLIYRNLLAAGEPGGGKSGLLNTFAAHAALSIRNRNVLFDGKQVELGMWDDLADEFVGPDLDHAIITLRRLQKVMDNRYTWLRAHRRRKIEPTDDVNVITSIFDEIALYSTVLGTETQQREFVALFRDLVARGRAAAMPVIAATQRPSVDIIPKSVRDLFGYRAAFRCTSTGSSNIILGDGWSEAGFDATTISPINPGVAYLIAEGGVPQKIKAAYLTDEHIIALADHAAWTRRTPHPGHSTGHHPGDRPRRLIPEGKPSCPTAPIPTPGPASSATCAPWPTSWTATRPSPSRCTASTCLCTPPAPTTADVIRSTTSPACSAPPSSTTPPAAAITAPNAPSGRSPTASSPSPKRTWPPITPSTPTTAASARTRHDHPHPSPRLLRDPRRPPGCHAFP